MPLPSASDSSRRSSVSANAASLNDRSLISPDTLSHAEDARRKIIAGEIKVTDAMTK